MDYIENEPNEFKLNSWIFTQTKIDIINRALRNCTWSADLYITKMRTIEKTINKREDLPVIREIVEFALCAGFETPEPLVKIWMEYLTILCRHSKMDEEDGAYIRSNFKLCWDNLGEMWGALADCNCEILQFWGRLEYDYFKEMIKGRDLWLTVMESADNSTKSGLWIEFAELEFKRGRAPARE